MSDESAARDWIVVGRDEDLQVGLDAYRDAVRRACLAEAVAAVEGVEVWDQCECQDATEGKKQCVAALRSIGEGGAK